MATCHHLSVAPSCKKCIWRWKPRTKLKTNHLLNWCFSYWIRLVFTMKLSTSASRLRALTIKSSSITWVNPLWRLTQQALELTCSRKLKLLQLTLKISQLANWHRVRKRYSWTTNHRKLFSFSMSTEKISFNNQTLANKFFWRRTTTFLRTKKWAWTNLKTHMLAPAFSKSSCLRMLSLLGNSMRS